MRSEAKRLLAALGLGLGSALIMMWFLGCALDIHAAPATEMHVCLEACAYSSVQAAVDAAGNGDVILVAGGVYSGVNNYAGLSQVVYISKTLSIRGGYSPDNWTTPDYETNHTTLDAQGEGRALYIAPGVSPTIEGFRITGGDAIGLGGGPWGDDAGGGVYVTGASPTISACHIFDNWAYHGGGVYVLASDAARIWGSRIAYNEADQGGGMYLNLGDATLEHNTVLSNTAGVGAGLFLRSCDATLWANDVSLNNASTAGGGLVLVYGNPVLEGNRIIANSAAWIGGGLQLGESNAVLTANTILSNTADQGGGLYLSSSSDLVMANNVLAGNRAETAGSALYVKGSRGVLLHSTIARNQCPSGSSVHVTDYTDVGVTYRSTVEMTNTILVSHTVAVYVTPGNTVTLEATLWGMGAWSNVTNTVGAVLSGTNLTGDPGFVDPDAMDYHIGSASDAVDAGANANVDVDIDGDPRPAGSGYDIGADEFWWRTCLPVVLRYASH